MSFIIEGDLNRNEHPFFIPGNEDVLYRRFRELYADRFTYRLSSGSVNDK